MADRRDRSVTVIRSRHRKASEIDSSGFVHYNCQRSDIRLTLAIEGKYREMRKTLAAIVLIVCAIFSVLFFFRSRAQKPNVILIVIETFRKDFFTESNAPNLTAFSRECVTFENAFSPSSWTIPAHASLFTGLYPSNHNTISDLNGTVEIGEAGLRFNELEEELVTISEILKDNGYQTSAVVGNFVLFPDTGLNQGFDTYLFPDMKSVPRDAAALNGHIFQILETAEEPFFLFVNYFDPHEPYDSPESKIKRNDSYNKDFLAYALQVLMGKRRVTEEEIRTITAMYAEEIRYVDKHIGKLLDRLKQANQYENSMIIITSDHGEHFGENNLMLHGCSLDDPLIRVPLLVKLPRSSSGETSTNYVQLTDIVPTILDICKIEYDKDKLDGENLLTANHGVRAELHPLPSHVKLNPERFNKHSVLTISPSGDRKLEVWENLTVPTTPARKQYKDPHTIETLKSLGYIF